MLSVQDLIACLFPVTFLSEVQLTKNYGEITSNCKVAEKNMTLIPKLTEYD